MSLCKQVFYIFRAHQEGYLAFYLCISFLSHLCFAFAVSSTYWRDGNYFQYQKKTENDKRLCKYSIYCTLLSLQLQLQIYTSLLWTSIVSAGGVRLQTALQIPTWKIQTWGIRLIKNNDQSGTWLLTFDLFSRKPYEFRFTFHKDKSEIAEVYLL